MAGGSHNDLYFECTEEENELRILDALNGEDSRYYTCLTSAPVNINGFFAPNTVDLTSTVELATGPRWTEDADETCYSFVPAPEPLD